MNEEADAEVHELQEDARLGFQVATNLWIYEGQLVWSRFNVMLVANSLIFTAASLLSATQSPPVLIGYGLPVAGLILCFAWFLIAKRGSEYQTYYVLSAREIEERYFNHAFNISSRGGAFADGKAVKLQLKGGVITHRMGFWSRSIRAREAPYIVILVFTVLYAMLLLH